MITRLNIGGPARHALLLTKHLVQYPTVLVAGTPAPNEGELSDPAVPVQRVPLVRLLRPGTDIQALMRVRRLIQNLQPAIVHTHMAKAGAIGRLAACSLSRRPVTIHTFHGHVLEGYFSRPVERAFLETERMLARSTDLLLAVSPEVREGLLELGIGAPDRFRVVPLGLELDSYFAVTDPCGLLREELGLDREAKLVGIVGRLVPVKDHECIFRAVRQLPGVHLAVVGDGELRAQLEAGIRGDENLRGRVHFTGWRHDLPQVLSDLDVVALSSKNEGTPVALIEALAAGRPAVATNVGGVASVIRDRETGLLAAPGDANGLAAHIKTLLQDEGTVRRLREAGRTHVARTFGLEALLSNMTAAYDHALASRVASQGRA